MLTWIRTFFSRSTPSEGALEGWTGRKNRLKEGCKEFASRVFSPKSLGVCLRALGYVLMLGYCGMILVPALLGGRCFAITGNSMSPAIPQGSLVVAFPCTQEEVRIGDVVVISEGGEGRAFTHRVVGLNPEKGWVYTQGDHNNAQDPVPTAFKYVYGRTRFYVPLLGYGSVVMRSTWGIVAALVIAGSWVGLELVLSRKRRTPPCEHDESIPS